MISRFFDRLEKHPAGQLITTGLIVGTVATVFLTCTPHPSTQPVYTFEADSATGFYRTPDTTAGSMAITADTGDARVNSNGTLMMSTQAEQSLTFVTRSQTVFTITPEGKFILGPGATVDDVARAIATLAEQYIGRPCKDSSTVHWDPLADELVATPNRKCVCR